jgi:hypothetical protein
LEEKGFCAVAGLCDAQEDGIAEKGRDDCGWVKAERGTDTERTYSLALLWDR